MFDGFLYPYAAACISAAYSFSQNLLGLNNRQLGGLPLPFDQLVEIYDLLLLGVCLLSLRAAWVMSWRLSFALFVLLLLPGISSSLGLQSPIEPVPDLIVLGGDYLGAKGGTVINLAMLFALSWAGFILYFRRHPKMDIPKHAFDHIWYAIGLAAAIFLVSDSSQKEALQSRQEEEQVVTQGTTLLATQTFSAAKLCRFRTKVISKLTSKPEAFCKWIDAFQGHIWFLANTNWVSRNNSSPEQMEDFFSVAQDQGITAKEAQRLLREYNTNACTRPETINLCSRVPDLLNSFSSLSVSPTMEYALALEPVAPSIARSWTLSGKDSKRLDANGPQFTFRWFFFLLLAVLAGGKVSFATRSLFNEVTPASFKDDRNRLARFVRSRPQLVATWMARWKKTK